MASSKSLCKIASGNKEYYILTTCHDGGARGFDIALCDCRDAWSSSVSRSELEKMCKKLKMSVDDFVMQTHKALTRENIGSYNFEYQVKPSGVNSLQLAWKKHVTAENIKFQLGSVDLEKKIDPSEVIAAVFDHAIDSTGDLQEQITALQSDCQRLAAERASALKRLEKCVAAKEEMEGDLYSKFLVVVNNKKDKIRSLREEVESLEAGVPSRSQESVVPSTSRGGHSAADVFPSSDEDRDKGVQSKRDDSTDSEYHTDDDEKDKVTPPPRKRSKVKVKDETLDTSGDQSLMLDDGAGDTSPQATGRRRRRGAAAKKQTPSKPIIPKVPSSEQKGKMSRDSSRRTPMTKAASSVSNRSSDNIDAEDLIDDM